MRRPLDPTRLRHGCVRWGAAFLGLLLLAAEPAVAAPVAYHKLHLTVRTTSDWTRVGWDPSTVLTYRLLERPGGEGRVFPASNHLFLTQPLEAARNGASTETRLEIALPADRVDEPLTLQIDKGYLNSTFVEVRSSASALSPLDAVQHVGVAPDPGSENTRPLRLNVTALGSRAPQTAETPAADRFVWAFYYPWFTTEIWDRRQWLKDAPRFPYNSADREAIKRQIDQARSAGVDGFICSWAGVDWAPSNDQVLSTLLDVAAEKDFQISVYLETLAVSESGEVRPHAEERLLGWLRYLFERRTSHPAYYRRNGRPVFFLWAADRTPRESWGRIFASLEADGKHGFYHANNVGPDALDLFDSIHAYAVTEPDRLAALSDLSTPTVANYHLLDESRGAAIPTATVQPGFDEELQPNRFGRVLERESGELYRRSWRAALDAGARWILITSWNEFWEHTHIEPSENYGDRFLRITRELVSGWKPEHPQIAAGGIVNAASFRGGAVAPGEMLTIFGKALGPELGESFRLDDAGRASAELAGARVAFDGVPASLVFVSQGQVAAIVPPAGARRDRTLVEAEFRGRRSPGVELPVDTSAPGLFTLDASGSGPLAAVNESGEINSPDRPAPRGAVVALFGTGGGLIDSADPGTVAPTAEQWAADIAVTVGDAPASALYAGAAPGLLGAVFQINVRLHESTPIGDAVPVVVRTGGKRTQGSATLSVGPTAP